MSEAGLDGQILIILLLKGHLLLELMTVQTETDVKDLE